MNANQTNGPVPAAAMNPDILNAPPPERLVALFPQLEIRGLVGVGELGAVFRVEQKSLARPAALKVLPEGLGADERLVAAFIADARAVAPLTHPNLLRVYDFGRSDGLLWVLQEWIEGTTVRAALAEGPLTVARGTAWLAQVCRGLEHAHAHGVVHSDLRASNLMLGSGDRVKVMNFGLGRLLLASGVRSPLVVRAPELETPDAPPDPRSDVFALGVLLYEILVGERPVGEIALPSVARPVLNPEFDAVVVRCLEADPAARFPDCVALRHAFEGLAPWRAPDIAPVAPPPPAPVRTPRVATPVRPSARVAPATRGGGRWLGIGAFGAMAVAAWFIVLSPRDGDIAPEREEEVADLPDPNASTASSLGELVEQAANPAILPGVASEPPPAVEMTGPPAVAALSVAAGPAPPPAALATPGAGPTVITPETDAEPASTEPPAVSDPPPVHPRLAAAVPAIPELEQLRAQLVKSDAYPIAARADDKLDTLREQYATACARNLERVLGDEEEFWREEQELLALMGHPPDTLPESLPQEASALRAGWKHNFSQAVAPLARYRDIYRGQLDRIRHHYLRGNHERAVELLELERAAALDPAWFIARCTGHADACGLLVPGNVALAALGAVADGVDKPAAVNDGLDAPALGKLGIPVRVELGGVLRLARVRLQLHSRESRHYFRYRVRVSPDAEHWETVCDRGKDGRWKRWQTIQFAPRPVRFIEVIGTHNSLHATHFPICEIEAYCAPGDD